MAYPGKCLTAASASNRRVTDGGVPRPLSPFHHVDDRLLPLKQTVRNPLDPPSCAVCVHGERDEGGLAMGGACQVIALAIRESLAS